MVLCLKGKHPLSVSLFRKIFQLKNSSANYPGWVQVNQRSGIGHIFNGKTIPDSITNWKKEFVRARWVGGNWSTLFRKSFGRVIDGNPDSVTLSAEEEEAFKALTADNRCTDARDLLNEQVLVQVGLSKAKPGAASKIVEATFSLQGAGTETKRQKRYRLSRYDRVPPTILGFLRGSGSGASVEGGPSFQGPTSPVFRPSWGIRKRDSVLGDTRLAREWSKHSIPPVDYIYHEGVTGRDYEAVQLLGSQGIAAANVYWQGLIAHADAFRTKANDQETEALK